MSDYDKANKRERESNFKSKISPSSGMINVHGVAIIDEDQEHYLKPRILTNSEIEETVKWRMGKWYDKPIKNSNFETTSKTKKDLGIHQMKINTKHGEGCGYVIQPTEKDAYWNGQHRLCSFLENILDVTKENVVIPKLHVTGADTVVTDDDYCIFTHNRRSDSDNQILWSLPVQLGFMRPAVFKEMRNRAVNGYTEFKDKIPQVFFRGQASGKFKNSKGDYVSAWCVFNSIKTDGKDPSWDWIQGDEKLSYEECAMKLQRYAICKKHANSQNINLKLTSLPGIDEEKWNDNLNQIMKDVKGTFTSQLVMRQYKYHLVLEGNDWASGKLQSILGGSLVLMPEPEWENIMNYGWKPWEHYVPVDKDGGNLEEIFEWCENHQKECKTIIENANFHFRIHNLQNENRIFKRVIEKYNENLDINE